MKVTQNFTLVGPERTMENAAEFFATATRRIKTLGEELDRRFADLAKAQATLAAEGIEVNATFAPPLQAAYRVWSGGNEPLVTPRALR